VRRSRSCLPPEFKHFDRRSPVFEPVHGAFHGESGRGRFRAPNLHPSFAKLLSVTTFPYLKAPTARPLKTRPVSALAGIRPLALQEAASDWNYECSKESGQTTIFPPATKIQGNDQMGSDDRLLT